MVEGAGTKGMVVAHSQDAAGRRREKLVFSLSLSLWGSLHWARDNGGAPVTKKRKDRVWEI